MASAISFRFGRFKLNPRDTIEFRPPIALLSSPFPEAA
jgi:hypothetical protein